jgi:hypothetical protein
MSEANAGPISKRWNYNPASHYRLDVRGAEPPLPDFNGNTAATNGASIAERIQLTVDEMTKTRYMNPSTYLQNQEFIDRAIDDSTNIDPPPYTSCAGPSAAGTTLRDTDSTQLRITQKETPPLSNQQPLNNPVIACSKTRVEGKNTRQCSTRSRRQVSTAPVRVEFPDTVISPAHVGVYTSSSQAISGIFEKNHGQLSSVCAYDRGNRVMHVYPLGQAPSSKDLQQRGLESVWLPLQDEEESEAVLDTMLSDEILFHKDHSSRLRSASSTKRNSSLDRDCPPECPYIKDDWDSDGDSNFQGRYGSESEISTLSHLSWSPGEYYKVSKDAESDFEGTQLPDSPLELHTERRLYKANEKRADRSCDIDTWRKIDSSRDYMQKNILTQWPYHIEAGYTTSSTHSDGTLGQSANELLLLDNGMYFARCRDGQDLSAQQGDAPSSSRTPRSNSSELSLDLSLTNGFPLTVYADQLLETGGRYGGGEYTDFVRKDERDSQTMSRSGPEPMSPKARRADQNGSLTPRHSLGIQSEPALTDLRHGPLNFVNVLPDIDEASESDGRKCSDSCLPTSHDILPGKPLKFANSDKTSDHTILATSCKSWCSGNDQFPNALASNERKKVAGLVGIFQARGMIGPGLISGIQKTSKLSNPVDQCSDRTLASSAGTVNRGAVCGAGGTTPKHSRYLSSGTDAPTLHSLPTRPNSSSSDANTEASSMFGERLERFERPGAGSGEDANPAGSEEYFRDSLIYG